MKFTPPNIITTPDPVAKERAIMNALREYRRCEHEAPAAFVPGLFSRHWKGFAAGVAACLAIIIMTPHNAAPVLQNDDVAMLHEMRTLFGKQLTGIIESAGKVEPVVADGGGFSQSQPIVMTLQQNGKTLRIFCFSGNTITVPYAGKELRLTAVLGKDGNVIVEGDDFMWTTQHEAGDIPSGINAKALEPSL